MRYIKVVGNMKPRIKLVKCSAFFTRCYSAPRTLTDTLASDICKGTFGKRKPRDNPSSFGPSVLRNDERQERQLVLSGKYDIADKIHFRHAVKDDIKYVVQMAHEEGWSYSEFEYNVLLKLDPLSLIAAIDELGVPVGFVGVCTVLPGITYNGPFIIRKDFRGAGIGTTFLKIVEELLVDTNGCMDINYDFVEHYGQKGFTKKSYKFKTFTVMVGDECRIRHETDTGSSILPVTGNLFPFVLDYDKRVYKGLNRERILRACLFGDRVCTVAALCDGKVKGYGSLIQLTGNSYSISTVFGDNENIVEEILGYVLELVPNGATLCVSLVADKRLSKRFSKFTSYCLMQRIYNKFKLETDLDRIYYVNDFTL